MIDGLIEKRMKDCVFIALLSFPALILTKIFHPNKLLGISSICLVCFTLMFGWMIGLMEVKKRQKDEN